MDLAEKARKEKAKKKHHHHEFIKKDGSVEIHDENHNGIKIEEKHNHKDHMTYH